MQELINKSNVNSVICGTRSTPLHVAVEHNHLDIVLYLLELGADVHVKNYFHRVPLHFAKVRTDCLIFCCVLCISLNERIVLLANITSFISGLYSCVYKSSLFLKALEQARSIFYVVNLLY